MAKRKKKRTLDLDPSHVWTARPGYRIFVADRGAVRFDIPEDWVLVPDAVSAKIYDREPPDDECLLEVSYRRLPSSDWRALPVADLLAQVGADDHREVTSRGEILTVERFDLKLAWRESRFRDPTAQREAHSRMLLGFGGNVWCLITMAHWPEDAARAGAAWDEMLRTLRLGQYIADPRIGAAVTPRLN